MLNKINSVNSAAIPVINPNSTFQRGHTFKNPFNSKESGDVFVSSSKTMKTKESSLLSFGRSAKTLVQKLVIAAKGQFTKADKLFEQSLQEGNGNKLLKSLNRMNKALQQLKPSMAPEKYAVRVGHTGTRHLEAVNAIENKGIQNKLLLRAMDLFKESEGILEGQQAKTNYNLKAIESNIVGIVEGFGPAKNSIGFLKKIASKRASSSNEKGMGFLAKL